MKRLNWKGVACFVGVFLIVWACTKKQTEDPQQEDNVEKEADRTVLLTHIADHIILPGYAKFKIKLDTMSNASNRFLSNPDSASLVRFRQTWEEAYIEWQKVELFEVGPANKHSMRLYFNIYPADVAAINTGVANGTANLEVFPFAKQGFPAIDYLLNGQGSVNETVGKYANASDATNRKAYLQLIVNKMKSVLSVVQNEWATYRQEFVTSTKLDAGSPTSELVNAYVLNYERYIRSGKIGYPANVMVNDGKTYPEKVEAYYKGDLSLVLVKTAQQASLDFFNGKSVISGAEGPSFKKYLNELGAKDSKTGASLSDIINAQFAAINTHLNGLNINLSEQIKTDNQAMVDTYLAMQTLVRQLKVDMTSAMSVTITYQDTDGD